MEHTSRLPTIPPAATKMPFFSSPVDNATLHYRTYTPATTPTPFGTQVPTDTKVTLVFIHGWPMSSQMYEHLILKLCEERRIKCVASDRRGFGASHWSAPSAAGGDVTYDVLARDTVGLIKQLDFTSKSTSGFVFVAASMGCAETLLAYNYLPAELKDQCKGFIWIGPSMPFPLATEAHPEGPPRQLWDMILNGFREDRVGFTKAAVPGVFGMGPQFDMGVNISESVLARFESIVGQADALAIERCIQIMTQRDFTEDLKVFGREERKKVLVFHGDSDQGMPASMSANLIGEYVKHAEVKIFEKAAHGLYLTHADRVIEEVVDFVSGL